MAAPCLRGGHPGHPQLDGAGGGGEGRGGDLMAEAARQATGAAGSGVFPKTWRRRLAVWGAGVADRDERMSSGAPQVEIGGEGQVGGQRTVSAAPEACHPALVGRRDRSFALSRACCGLRRWTTPSALFSPRCRPAPSTHRPSCAQVGPRRGACDLPPAPPPPAVGSRAQGERRAAVCESPST